MDFGRSTLIPECSKGKPVEMFSENQIISLGEPIAIMTYDLFAVYGGWVGSNLRWRRGGKEVRGARLPTVYHSSPRHLCSMGTGSHLKGVFGRDQQHLIAILLPSPTVCPTVNGRLNGLVGGRMWVRHWRR
jgi:hypothetical protein